MKLKQWKNFTWADTERLQLEAEERAKLVKEVDKNRSILAYGKYIPIYLLWIFFGEKMLKILQISNVAWLYNLMRMQKGINYVKTLPNKAIILFIKSQIIIFIFLLTNFVLGIKVTYQNIFFRWFLNQA